jgi:Domain of unknown function (DUF4375)
LEFVDLIALTDYEDLTEIQQIAHLAFWYESEMQNGEHLQYFENRGLGQLTETLAALDKLGARCQRQVLLAASESSRSNPGDRIVTVEDYISRGLKG